MRTEVVGCPNTPGTPTPILGASKPRAGLRSQPHSAATSPRCPGRGLRPPHRPVPSPRPVPPAFPAPPPPQRPTIHLGTAGGGEKGPFLCPAELIPRGRNKRLFVTAARWDPVPMAGGTEVTPRPGTPVHGNREGGEHGMGSPGGPSVPTLPRCTCTIPARWLRGVPSPVPPHRLPALTREGQPEAGGSGGGRGAPGGGATQQEQQQQEQQQRAAHGWCLARSPSAGGRGGDVSSGYSPLPASPRGALPPHFMHGWQRCPRWDPSGLATVGTRKG